MRFLISLAAFMMISLPVQAAQDVACQVLQSHNPDGDVRHKGLADINGATNIVPDVIKVPLSVDLARRVASLSGKGIQMEAPLGMMEIHQDGSVKYNGEDWTSNVKTLCGQSLREVSVAQDPIVNQAPILNRTRILNTAPLNGSAADMQGDGQAAQDVIKQDKQEPAPLKPEMAVKEAVEKMDIIEVAPAVAIPPRDVTSSGTSVKVKSLETASESDVLEGGAYREIFFNE